ncbi:MAG: flagellar motor switch protein FliN [Acidimicrobiales bacterium]
MTPATTASIAEALPVVTERVVAAAARFPADGLVAGPADTQEVLAELLPAEDAFVLVVPAGPSPGQRLVLVVRPSLLKALGLSDADGLADALSPVIAELAGPHEVHHDQLRLGIGATGLADLPASGDGSGGSLVATGLFLGTDHVATVGIAIPGEGEGAGEVEDATAAPSDGMDLPEVDSPRTGTADAGGVGSEAIDGVRSLNLLRNVEMDVTAELGRSRMTVADLLSLTPGSVVELDKVAGSPIDLLVNGTLIARGEVVVIDEEFGVRLSEIVDRAEDH